MKKEKTITIHYKTELDYEIDQSVWFYLSDSIEILNGRVIGFFAILNNETAENNKSYLYQIEYFKEQKDGTKKMYIGNAVSADIDTNERGIKKRFEKIRSERVEAAIKSMEIELGGAKANRSHHDEAMKEIMGELERLKALRR